MKTLAEFDCIALQPRGADKASAEDLRAVFPHAKLAMASKYDQQIKVLNTMEGAFVLVLPVFVIPKIGLANVQPDAILLDAEYRLAWMSRNAVTGEITAKPGPELWRRGVLLEALSPEKLNKKTTDRVALMPDCLADWRFNTSSGAAFNAGMAYVTSLQYSGLTCKAIDQKLLISATIGQDTKYCDWWQLGIMRAILGDTDSHFAYLKEKDLTAEKGAMRQRLEDLYRELRLEHGLDARFISSQKSRFFKQNKFLMPQRSVFETLAVQYQTLGKAGKILSQRNREAADWIWGVV